jgi:hypothetical protein
MLSVPLHADTDEEYERKSTRSLLKTFKKPEHWDTWRFKSRTKLIKHQLWNPTLYARPTSIGYIQLSAAEFTTLSTARDVENAALEEGEAPDLTPIPTTRKETQAEFELRQFAYDKENQGLYDALVECTEGEPLQIVQTAFEGDGRQAWSELMKRYGAITVASQLTIIKELFELKLKSGIEKHVTTWKASLRKLIEYNLKFGDPIIVVMFLQTLPGTYSPFKTYSMMQPEINSEKLYLAAIEFARANLPNDEADNSGAAMAAQEGPCRFGDKCWNKDKGCAFTHHHSTQERPFKTYKVGKGKGKGGQQGGWECSRCHGINFNQHSTRCYKCKLPRNSNNNNKPSNGKGTFEKRKLEEANAVIKTKLTASSKQVDALTKLNKRLKLSHKAHGIELDSDDGHVATEIYDEALTAETTGITTFKIDSGASSHFGGSSLPITYMQHCNTNVQTADGAIINVIKKGTFTGVTPQNNKLSFTVKKNKAFAHNLFSVKQATAEGYKFTFDADTAHMTCKKTGDAIPLQATRTGWNLNMVN